MGMCCLDGASAGLRSDGSQRSVGTSAPARHQAAHCRATRIRPREEERPLVRAKTDERLSERKSTRFPNIRLSLRA